MVLDPRQRVQRILVAGTGSIGRRHIANLRALRPAARWALLRDHARQDSLSQELDAEVFGSLDEALSWLPELAVVATPSDRHVEVLPGLLAAGVACFIEKPVVIRASDVSLLRDLSPEKLPPTQVGCVLRFLPSLCQVHHWLRSGLLGNVVRATFEVGQWLPDWRPSQDYRQSYSAQRSRGGGVVFDLIHELDLACWMFDSPRLLGAWGDQLSSLELESDDVSMLALRARNGTLISVQLDYVSRQPTRRIHIVGDQGSIHWDLPNQRCTLSRPGLGDEFAHGFDTKATYIAAMEDLLEGIENGQATTLPLALGLEATALAISAAAQTAANASSRFVHIP